MNAAFPPEEKAYQLSHPNETSVHGLITYQIVGLCIIEFAVLLRFWSRKMQKMPWKADDYCLIVAAVLVIGHCVCIVLNIKHGFGHHTLTVTPAQSRVRGRVGYAYNFIYHTTFPISRIALVLLYKRVFNAKQWFQYACWFLISVYIGYMISFDITVAVATLPVSANWDRAVKPTRTVKFQKLQLANCSFNITTDAILLVLPLMVIWTLHMSKLHKLGVSAIFCLGVLTLIASIMRTYYTFHANNYDPLFDQGHTGWWTVTEVYLGILCPCIVTFRPLVWSGYRFFSSFLSKSNRARVAQVTGVDTAPDSDYSGKKVNEYSDSAVLRSKQSDLEARASTHEGEEVSEYPATDKAHWYNSSTQQLGKNKDGDGMVQNQDVALANLDPRSQARDLGAGQTARLGTSSHVLAEGETRYAPEQGIGVCQSWNLESAERGR